MPDPTARFSDRVSNYVKYRPGYPPEIIAVLTEECGLEPGHVVADIGSGTGISAKMFLDNGNAVIGVEPNEAMRAAAEALLVDRQGFRSVDGRAESTGLDDDSIDLVVAAQAFHWFDRPRVHDEFRRILRPPGRTALIWNERRLDATPFLAAYESILKAYSTDYAEIRHDLIGEAELREVLPDGFRTAQFEYVQQLDADGLVGRAASSSYMPNENEPAFAELRNELADLFAKHERNGRIEIFYDTNLYFSCTSICQ
jgi:SAM-dependent methyltransferase